MAGNRWRGFPPQCPDRFGGGPRAKPIHSSTTLATVNKKAALFAFANTGESWSLGGDRTYCNGVAVQNTGYSGILAGLLVQRGQSRFVGGFQNINFLTHDQRELGAMRDAGAGAIRWRSVHVLSAAHGVANLAGKGLLAAGERVKTRKCSC